MLYLSDEQVRSLIGDDISWVVEIMRAMFKTIDAGDYALGGKLNASHGLRMSYELGGSERMFIAMPAYLGGDFNVAGEKWHGPNSSTLGGSSDTYYTVILNDADTGIPFATMRADWLTRYRAAAVNVLAASVLVSGDPKAVGIIGSGRINALVLKGLVDRFPMVKKIYIKGRSKDSLDRFISVAKADYSGVDIIPVQTVKDAVVESDIVSINTLLQFASYGDMPAVRASWAKRGSVFLCSSFSCFPDQMVIKNSINVCDLYSMYNSYEEELGYPAYKKLGFIGNRFADLVKEGKLARSDIKNLGAFVTGHDTIDIDSGKPVIFSSGGLALEDIALGMELYKRARALKIGTELDD